MKVKDLVKKLLECNQEAEFEIIAENKVQIGSQ
jgi:hypothetical protein